MKRLLEIAGLVGMGLLFGTGATYAEKQVYRPRHTTTQWRTMVREAPVRELHVYARRASGSDTYYNMRFGRESHTFDGRRVYLKGSGMVKASWNLNGRKPNGKELILNAYNGSVFVEKVEVVYQDGRHHTSRPEYYDSGGYNSHQRDNGYGYRNEEYYRNDDRYRRDERYRYQDQYRYEARTRDYGNDRYVPRYDARKEHPRGCSCSQHRREVRYHASSRYAPRRVEGPRNRGW